HGFEDGELVALRKPDRGELKALEIAAVAVILAEEELLVDLLEIEREVEGPAQPGIGELRPPRVEDIGLHAAGGADRKLLLDHAAVLDRGNAVIGGGPVLGAVLGAPIDRAGLERLDRHRRIAEVFESQGLEVAAAEIDVEVLAPIILDALVGDVAARRER